MTLYQRYLNGETTTVYDDIAKLGIRRRFTIR
jgi:hypothetical protein